MRDFDDMYVNLNSSSMQFDFYLQLNDPLTKKSDADKRVNGVTKTATRGKKELVVVSPKAQKVWVTFTTWDKDVFPSQCTGGYAEKAAHYFKPTPQGGWFAHSCKNGGPLQLGPYNFKANEYQDFEVHFEVGDRTNPADWSLVAWGESGDVFVYPKDGVKSSAWKTDASHRKPAGDKPATWDATKPKKRDRDSAEVKAKTVKSRKVEWAADPAAVLEKNLIKLAPSAKADAFKAGTGAAADGLALLSEPQNLGGILA